MPFKSHLSPDERRRIEAARPKLSPTEKRRIDGEIAFAHLLDELYPGVPYEDILWGVGDFVSGFPAIVALLNRVAQRAELTPDGQVDWARELSALAP